MLSGWMPGRGPAGRTRDALVRGAMRLMFARVVPGLNAVLAAHELAPVRDTFELFDRCRAVLVMTSPSFDFQSPHFPANVPSSGPQLDGPDSAANGTGGREGGEPLVLVATSSVFQDQVGLCAAWPTHWAGCRCGAWSPPAGRSTPADVPAPGNVPVVRAAPHRRRARRGRPSS